MATRGTLLIAPLLPLLVSILFLSSLNIADSRNTLAVAIGDRFCGPPAWRRISVQSILPFSSLMLASPSDSAESRLTNVKAVFRTAIRLDLGPVFLEPGRLLVDIGELAGA